MEIYILMTKRMNNLFMTRYIFLIFISITSLLYPQKKPVVEEIINKVNIDTLMNNLSELTGEKEISLSAGNIKITSRYRNNLGNTYAFQYLKKKFDVIVVDIFTGKESFGPKGIKINYIKKLTHLLKPSGALIFNRLAHRKDLQEETQILESFLSTIFNSVGRIRIQDPRGYRNELVIACKITQRKK